MKTKIITIILSIIILISINVTALGIAPSRKIIEYNTNENIITSRIINNNAQNIKVQIAVGGELAQYIKINNPMLYISSSEYEKEFTYTVILPEKLEPGSYNNQIIATEIEDVQNNNNSVGGRLAVIQQLTIIAENGKKIVIEPTITTTNNIVTTTININNIGTEIIQSLTGTITIKDTSNKTVTTQKIEEKNNIQSKEVIKIIETTTINKPGKYVIEYHINYDDKEIVLEKETTIGKYEVEITKTEVNNFRLGTTAKFNIDLLNNWNAIENVQGEVTIQDINNNTIGKTQITATQINPKKDTLIAYWDTTNIKAGEYTIKVNLYTAEKTITQEYKAIIKEDTIEITDTATSKNKKTYYTITAITALLWIIILVLLIRKNTKKK